MNFYKALEALENGEYDKITEAYDKYAGDIEKCREMLFQDAFLDEEACTEVLNKLTAIKMYLEPVYLACETFKEMRQGQIFYELKVDFQKNKKEDSKEKFVSSSAMSEASYKVNDLRRLRNAIEAPVKQCETGILTCQSTLKKFNSNANR